MTSGQGRRRKARKKMQLASQTYTGFFCCWRVLDRSRERNEWAKKTGVLRLKIHREKNHVAPSEHRKQARKMPYCVRDRHVFLLEAYLLLFCMGKEWPVSGIGTVQCKRQRAYHTTYDNTATAACANATTVVFFLGGCKQSVEVHRLYVIVLQL